MGHSTMLTFFCASITLFSLVKCVRCQHPGEVIIPVNHFLPKDVERNRHENGSIAMDEEAKQLDEYKMVNVERTPRFESKSTANDVSNIPMNSDPEKDITIVWETLSPLLRSVRDTGVSSQSADEDAQFEARKKYNIPHGTKFGRKKLGKKKHLKWLYPVFIGIFISKIILLPMIIKAVTFMSSTSFVLSKMSLLATIILGLKFFLTNTNQAKMNDSRVEIIHVPIKKDYSSTWDRETAENKIHPQYHPQEALMETDFKPTQYNMNFE